jgi:cellulose synthase/poly-beta-1,6-N-acetylglucosamine synthase-like glycosyltransferase
MAVEVFPIDRASAQVVVNAAVNWLAGGDGRTSARQRLSTGQRVGIVLLALVVVAGLIVAPVGTAVLGAAFFTLAYLATLAHRVLMFRASMRADPFHRVSDEEARAVPDDDLPMYTLLVPAFGEPEVMADLIRSLSRLDYPRHRMAVELLLEEGDDATLAAALACDTDMVVNVRVLPVGSPQTKPRALNYGLLLSESELVTIYDAEDRPEPLQLRRAAVALGRLGPEWGCLQARLGFYEADRNLLSKWFCAEYLTWFTCFLPGAVELGGVVPLGGTSNHFRRAALDDVGAWDPFNVTEDADLGIRLQRNGYRIGVLDSETLEEVNSDTINWVKQRSRWQKGYLQTALVHLRRPRRVIDELGWKGLVHLLLFIGGTPLLAVANLCFWALTAFWFATRAHAVETVFPGIVFYMATAAWLLGNFVMAYLGVVTLLITEREELLPAVLMAPLYWVLMSIASLRAAIQLVIDPFHWEKTTHGLAPSDPPAEPTSSIPTPIPTSIPTSIPPSMPGVGTPSVDSGHAPSLVTVGRMGRQPPVLEGRPTR